jgi:beta-glucosidase
VLQIPQLYVKFLESSEEPPSVLRGFTDVEAHPGEKMNITTVEFKSIRQSRVTEGT